ncbi:hypothetical protein BDV06DRAFT_37610 [Aspergillus oleicola]
MQSIPPSSLPICPTVLAHHSLSAGQGGTLVHLRDPSPITTLSPSASEEAKRGLHGNALLLPPYWSVSIIHAVESSPVARKPITNPCQLAMVWRVNLRCLAICEAM